MAATSVDQVKQILKDANDRVARQHYAVSLLAPVGFNLIQPWLNGYDGQFGSVAGSIGPPCWPSTARASGSMLNLKKIDGTLKSKQTINTRGLVLW